MPYRQVFHDNSEFNNKIIDKPLFHDGDGFGSFFSSLGNIGGIAGRTASTISNLGSKAASFVGQNKDAISGVASLAGGIKNVADTINSTKRANEELRQMQIKFDNEVNMYQKIIDLQNKVKKVYSDQRSRDVNVSNEKKRLESSSIAKPEIPKIVPTFVDKKIRDDEPITYLANNNETKSKNSSLTDSQLEAIRNMNRKGEGIKGTKMSREQSSLKSKSPKLKLFLILIFSI